MEDNLVEELRNSMHSFTEECICPVCEGHGAISKAADSAVREWMPSAKVDGINVENTRAAAEMGQSLNFTITGHFTTHDRTLNQQSWEEIEGKARESFEEFLTWLHNKWKANTSSNFNTIKQAIEASIKAAESPAICGPSVIMGNKQQIDQYEALMKDQSDQMAKLANASKSPYVYVPWPGYSDEQKAELASLMGAVKGGGV